MPSLPPTVERAQISTVERISSLHLAAHGVRALVVAGMMLGTVALRFPPLESLDAWIEHIELGEVGTVGASCLRKVVLLSRNGRVGEFLDELSRGLSASVFCHSVLDGILVYFVQRHLPSNTSLYTAQAFLSSSTFPCCPTCVPSSFALRCLFMASPPSQPTSRRVCSGCCWNSART